MKLTNEVSRIVMWGYRHSNVTKEIYYFIDVTKVCSLYIKHNNSLSLCYIHTYIIYLLYKEIRFKAKYKI